MEREKLAQRAKAASLMAAWEAECQAIRAARKATLLHSVMMECKAKKLDAASMTYAAARQALEIGEHER